MTDLRNQPATIFPNVAKATAWVAANAEYLDDGEAYEVRPNPKGESAIIAVLIDGDFALFI